MQQTSVDFIDVPYEEMLDEIRRSGLVHTSWNPAEDSTKKYGERKRAPPNELRCKCLQVLRKLEQRDEVVKLDVKEHFDFSDTEDIPRRIKKKEEKLANDYKALCEQAETHNHHGKVIEGFELVYPSL